jgi:hypothetical protein
VFPLPIFERLSRITLVVNKSLVNRTIVAGHGPKMLQGFPEGDGERVFLVREFVSDNTPPWREVVGRGASMHLAFLLSEAIVCFFWAGF